MLNAEWLSRTITVPYLPTLGPVHPDTDLAALLNAVHTVEPGVFLPYDKMRRWYPAKDEHVLPELTEHTERHTRVITINRRGAGSLRLHHYASEAPSLVEARETAGKLAAGHGTATATVIWTQQHPPRPPATATRVWLAPTAEHTATPSVEIVELEACPQRIRDTFTQFALSCGDAGMTAFEQRVVAAGCPIGPILTAIARDRVIGAIGPMETQLDPHQRTQLLPQYFAVLPEHRRAGAGRALWQAAQRWGRAAGAAYQLLQTTAGSPADQLYRSTGCHNLGIVCTTTT